MKILTIAIPVYNTEKYLERCLRSITLKEILDDIEIILVNDGSKDNSIKILNQYAAKFPKSIKVIDKENGGHGSTINAALKIATGKYFKVLDSDDWVDSYNFMELIAILKNSDEDIVASPYTEEHTYIPMVIPYDYKKAPKNETLDFNALVYDDAMDFYFPMASATYKLEVLKKCGLELFEKTFYVDMQFNIMPIPFVNTIKYLEKPVYRYFIGRPTQSMSQENLVRNYTHHQRVLKFIIEYYAKYHNEISATKENYMRFICTSMIYTFFTIVCVEIKDKKLSYRVIKEFDAYLKQTSPELYESSNIYGYVRYSRKMKFINVRCFMKLFIRLMNLARRIR